uniref:G_PROTEIN_RECEP_F1_2 domain-containing protein n=1 Tax=Rhabditophanes sp. KR3021 TaxID=114890 RepID=A0AC35TN74_9BILA
MAKELTTLPDIDIISEIKSTEQTIYIVVVSLTLGLSFFLNIFMIVTFYAHRNVNRIIEDFVEVYSPENDTMIEVIRRLPKSLEEFPTYITLATDYFILMNPVVLFILYVLTFFKVKKMSKKANCNSDTPQQRAISTIATRRPPPNKQLRSISVLGGCTVFEILCEFQTLAYTAWVCLIICLSVNRFLTFINPTIIRKNSRQQIIVLCFLSWVTAIAFVFLKRFLQIGKTFDYEQLIVKDDMSKSGDFGVELYKIAKWIYNVSPTLLFILYIFSFIKVRRFTKLRSNSAVSTIKMEIKNSINYEKIILIQGFFICLTWQINTIIEYAAAEVMRRMDTGGENFYLNFLESSFHVILSMINPITFFICNRTAKDYLVNSFKFW